MESGMSPTIVALVVVEVILMIAIPIVAILVLPETLGPGDAARTGGGRDIRGFAQILHIGNSVLGRIFPMAGRFDRAGHRVGTISRASSKRLRAIWSIASGRRMRVVGAKPSSLAWATVALSRS